MPKNPTLKVVVVEDWAELEPYVTAWDALADHALEPNVYFESWMLLPALKLFGPGRDVRVVLVLADLPAESGHAPLLCGLFPLERRRRCKGLPIGTLALWQYVHCFLCTPLVHAAYARPCLEAFFTWLAADRRGAPLLECPWIPGEGPFHRLFVELLDERRLPALVDECFTRALLCPRASAQVYLQETLSGERRRQLRRREEKLAALGSLDYTVLESNGAVEDWLEEFLHLEAGGWKGREGTALVCRETDRQFFRTALTEAHRRGRLFMLALRLGGRPVALLCDLLSGQGSFTFKLTFDEAHASCSPGILLELERIRQVHNRPALRWVDSCNAPGPSFFKDLWHDRRLIQTVLVAPGKAPGPFFLAVLPLLRWVRRKVVGLLQCLPGRRGARPGGSS